MKASRWVLAGCGGVALSLAAGLAPISSTPVLATGAAVAVRAAVTPQSAAPAAPSAPPSAAVVRPAPPADGALIARYCVTCHNERLKTAGLVLDPVAAADPGRQAPVWERVVRKLRTGAMPPAGSPRPSPDTVAAFAARVEGLLDRAAAARPDPGRPAVHRLNRAEYANAVRDLLAVEIDARAVLPADDADEQGFDNIADVLSVSPALLDRYMAAARKVSRQALGRPAAGATTQTYDVPRLLVQDGRMSDDLPFGSRGGVAVRHTFPVDGEYSIKIKLQTNLYDYIRGLGRRHQLEVRIDGARVARFTVGGEDKGTPAPASFAGAIFGSPEWEKYAHDADAALEARFAAKAGTRSVGVAFVGEPSLAREGVLQPRQVSYPLAIDEMQDGDPGVERVTLGGPFTSTGSGDTPSRRRVLSCTPASAMAERECARTIVAALARRAFRRPVVDADVEGLLAFFERGRRDGGFEAGIQLVLERLLVDPEFLFRIERDPAATAPGGAYPISDLELAARLSFFLWSSIPDDELLGVATQGRLRQPGVLDRQLRRLLADARSRHALVDNFAGQWLELRNVREHMADPDTFADFDENLRDAMRREMELFLDSQLAADHRVTDLLDTDYTFLNERLARHYGVPGIYGERFRRVTLAPAQASRRGLLGKAGLLTVTSYPNRTSPVLRGKWVLANLLGAPPPPPPPNVPSLRDTDASGRVVSVRERLEEHRRNPVCSTCHARMDPIGFALENFDATGRWRQTAEGGSRIDASGVLGDGSAFEGPDGLRAVLLARRDQFVVTLTEKLLSYAVGRRLEPADQPAVRAIVRAAAPDGYRWSSIVRGIVHSVPFQMRRAEP